jgi:hypothetical protein
VSTDVPQIWLTYSEFAALIDCDPAEARKASIAAGLDRRKSRDGETRIKLTPQLATAFLDIFMQRSLERQMTDCVSDLRTTHELMQKQLVVTPKSPLRRALRNSADGGPGAA